jgi:hypothetical protein
MSSNRFPIFVSNSLFNHENMSDIFDNDKTNEHE